MKIKIKYASAIIVVFIVVIVLLVYPFSQSKKSDEIDSTKISYEKLDEVIFDVKTAPVLLGSLVLKTNANGIVRAAKEVGVSSNITGYIKSINIYDGKQVKKGDLLIQLEDREYQIELKEAEANLIEARVEYGLLVKYNPIEGVSTEKENQLKKTLDNLSSQFSSGFISEEQYVNKRDSLELELIFTGAKKEEMLLSKSGFTRARNAVERAKLNLEYTKIRAPFNGVIGDFYSSEGQRISAGEELFKLFDMAELLVNIGLIESEISNVSLGNSVVLQFNALPGKTYSGKVKHISPYIDPETKTAKVTISVNNADRMINPGMFASASIETERLENRLLIPKAALLIRDERELVFTVEANLAKWKYVDIGKQNDRHIEILKGLSPQDSVIVEGHYTLAHDSKVKVINR